MPTPPGAGERHAAAHRRGVATTRRPRRRGRRTTSAATAGCRGSASSDRRARELARQIRMRDLEHVHRRARGRAAGARRGRRARRRRAARRGPAPRSPATRRSGRRARRHQPRRSVHGGAVVVAVAQLGFAGVDADADLQPADRVPARVVIARCASIAAATATGGGRRTRRARRRRWSSRHAVVRRDRHPQDLVVARQALRIASGCSSHSRVDPSMSEKRNVTVPDGRSVIAEVHCRIRPGGAREVRPVPDAGAVSVVELDAVLRPEARGDRATPSASATTRCGWASTTPAPTRTSPRPTSSSPRRRR